MKHLFFILIAISLFSCSSDNNSTNPPVNTDTFIRAADMSYLPLIESEGTVYKHNGVAQDAIMTLKMQDATQSGFAFGLTLLTDIPLRLK
jgi:arabinogalactan endo-1,4-beta-galactosidase